MTTSCRSGKRVAGVPRDGHQVVAEGPDGHVRERGIPPVPADVEEQDLVPGLRQGLGERQHGGVVGAPAVREEDQRGSKG